MYYMEYYPMIPRRQLASEEKHLDSTTMWSHEHYIADRMVGSCFLTFHTKRYKKRSREAHNGMCRAHQPGPRLGDQFRKLGYDWPKMIFLYHRLS